MRLASLPQGYLNRSDNLYVHKSGSIYSQQISNITLDIQLLFNCQSACNAQNTLTLHKVQRA